MFAHLYVHDIHNVDVWLRDVAVVNAGWGKFDILFHVGVLYHLLNPVAHLFSLQGMADQLLLQTAYGTDALGFPRCAVKYGGKRYLGYLKQEHGWAAPYGGIGPVSCWLARDVLLELLHEIGYRQVDVVFEDVSNVSAFCGCVQDVGYAAANVTCQKWISSMPKLIVAAKR